ncbi:MAG: hypothetical protein JGK17_11340 [Microcoleus sp. PH2017_10_PVI_O_A]|uniref:hypothetical protein n=1 Tax=unclassified Microcoleus TaxID=2642155 RepID=UPI001E071884|nr:MULTISPECIES: hypothetical protein [unclassified Microcoleus]TAE82481.1 MAG: hypothetical protein EAZ83_12465 [Oscillatoriales cyanobacterium]MCC3406164.1 hypothetical protein [Microcoleus sp. PH2017_10_PVI_O_A]MCC3460755.1 hypothetical protein [Microcoleus sp. PH2017_11_PCY_U_A]MCC3479317.1 hypothetical protein [Microcoleus sp. PH2017_12_PCY_D_A]MCC3560158.1 hypothetical protein [Microcoleus sp. PH2017_27_LUM_O_A]
MANRLRPIFISFLICIFFLTLYHTLVLGGVVLPSDGINGPQSNTIKAQRYIYHQKSEREIVLVGSSITARLDPEYISPQAVSLALLGMSSPTGLQIIEREKVKPKILLVELSETILKGEKYKASQDFIGNLYQPLFYFIRLQFPMFRQEYQPLSSIIQSSIKAVTNEKKVSFRFLEEANSTQKQIDPGLIEKLIRQQIQTKKNPISEGVKNAIIEESEYIKTKITQLKNAGVRVILMDVPNEQRVKDTIVEKQLRELLRDIFPENIYEWLPEPPSREWKTNDGIHLVTSSAKEYANFVRTQLFKTAQ